MRGMGWMVAIVAGLASVVALATIPSARACTRCVYLGPQGTVVVARSMDWAQNPGTNLFCFPRGMERDGAAGPNSVKWTPSTA